MEMGTAKFDSNTAEGNERASAERKATKRGLNIRETITLGIGLNAEERAIITALRTLRTEECREQALPSMLLEHGYVSKLTAAKLLSEALGARITLKDLEAMRSQRSYSDDLNYLPFTKGGRVPLSELRRQVARSRRESLKGLAQKVVDHVKTVGATHWSPDTFSFLLDDDLSDYHSPDEVAQALGISKAAARRLFHNNDKNGLFVRRHPRLYGWVITTEELEAFKRRGEAARAHQKAQMEAIARKAFSGSLGPTSAQKAVAA